MGLGGSRAQQILGKSNRVSFKNKRVSELISYKFYTSYGAIDCVSQFLCPLQVLQLQLLSTYFYKTAVSRV